MQRVLLQTTDAFIVDSISLPVVANENWELSDVFCTGGFNESCWVKQKFRTQTRRTFVGQFWNDSVVKEGSLCDILNTIVAGNDFTIGKLSWAKKEGNTWMGTDGSVCVCAATFGEIVIMMGVEVVAGADEWDRIVASFLECLSTTQPLIPYFYFAIGVNFRPSSSTVLIPQSAGCQRSCWSQVAVKEEDIPVGTELHITTSQAEHSRIRLSLEEPPLQPTPRVKTWIDSAIQDFEGDDFSLESHDKLGPGVYVEHPRMGAKLGLKIDSEDCTDDVLVRPLYSRTSKKKLLSQQSSMQRTKQVKLSTTEQVPGSEQGNVIEFCIWLCRSQELQIPVSNSLELTPSVLYPLRLHPSITSLLVISRRTNLNFSDSVMLRTSSAEEIKYVRVREARSVVEYLDSIVYMNTKLGNMILVEKSPHKLVLRHPTRDVRFHWWVRLSGCLNAGVLEVVTTKVEDPTTTTTTAVPSSIEEIVSQLLE